MAMEHNEQTSPVIIKFAEIKPPVFKESKGKDWIDYGIDQKWRNQYPEYLLDLYNRSIKHNAIVTSKAKYIAGNGFRLVGEYNALQRSQAEDFLNKAVNKYDEGYSDLGYKCALDVEVFGGCYLEVVWDKKGKDFEIYHMDYCRLRIDKSEEFYWYSDDWSTANQSEEKTGLRKIELFDINNPKGSQIYVYKEYRPNLKYYPQPGYIGAITWVEIDYMIAQYHHGELASGFMAGTMINFNNGRPTTEEKAETERKIKGKFGGTKNAGEIVLTWNNSKENAPTIERISTGDMHSNVIALNKDSVISELIIGHQINSGTIFGVPSPAGLGSERSQMMTAYELFKSTYAEPKQRSLNIYFNYLLEAKGLPVKVALKEMPPITYQYSESALMQVMTKNEIRKELGLKPIEGFDAPKVESAPMVSSAIHRFEECEHHEFTEEDLQKTLSVFKKYGRASFNYHREMILSYKFSAVELDEDMKEIYRQVLDLIDKEPFITNEQIAELTKREVSNIEKLITRLEEAGAISTKEKKSYGDKVERRIISKEASNIIDSNPPKKSDWMVMYSYQWRPGVTPDIRTSRDFCKELLSLDRLYSKAEINQISAELGYDVWSKRGGWWTHAGSDGQIRTPYCRHIWAAEYVKEK